MEHIDQYYLDASNRVHFLSAQDQANALAQGLPLPDPSWTEITQDQAKDACALSSTDLWAEYQGNAHSALDASDNTVLRCYESGIALPAEWVAYRKTLRAIVSAKTGDASKPLPTKPAYPQGT